MKLFLIANGKIPNLLKYYQLLSPDQIIAVNGGTNKALKYNIYPHVVIGDLDSLKKKFQGKLIKYPKQKDKSDLELAIDYILSIKSITKLFCFGILGNRIDHTLVNLNLLSKFNYSPPIIIYPKQTITILTSNQSILNIPPKTKLSIISLDKTSQVLIEGFKYQGNYPIPFLSSLGISNISNSENNQILCQNGKIIILIYQEYYDLLHKNFLINPS
ncbi:MAG: thiamine diphosphokinase [bacterium]